MRLLIVEPDAEGHHMVLYTRLLLREAIERGWDVAILTTESARRHAAFDIISGECNGALRTMVMPEVERSGYGSLALLMSQLKLWQELKKACAANDHFADFDLVFFITLDFFEKALSVLGSPLGSKPFAGMLMNPKFHRAPMELGPPSRADAIYRWLFRRLLGTVNLKRLMVVDEPFRRYCEAQGTPNADKLCIVPDVGELSGLRPKDDARTGLGLSADKFVILVYGSLAARKGVEQLLRAVASVDDERVVALVAGMPDAAIEAVLASSWCRELQGSGRLIVRPFFHEDADEVAVFSAADVAWLGYVGGAYGSSGVLYQAGSAGLPVISMIDGLIGWSVREHKLGIPVDASNIAEIAEAIEFLHHDDIMRRECGDNGRRLAQSHTGRAFAGTLCDAFEAAAPDSRAS